MSDIITKEELKSYVMQELDHFLLSDLYEMHLPKEKLEWIREQKEELKEDLKRCLRLDYKAKERLQEFIDQSLERRYYQEKGFWTRVWLFRPEYENRRDIVFEKELFLMEKSYGKRGLSNWLEKNSAFLRMSDENEEGRRLGKETFRSFLSMQDQRSFLVSSLYKDLYGLGKLESLLPFAIDGISCGLNTQKDCSHHFWVMVDGNSIPLTFYSLEEEELRRLCRVLASACGYGEFHEEQGYCMGDLQKSMRCIVLRPPFAEGWTFFLRRFDSVENKSLDQLVKGPGAEEVRKLLKMMIKGNQTISITGMQGSGKTTLLMGLVEEIPREYTLRILETVFELHLRKLYPERNVLSIRETELISGQEGLSVLKKTDGNVTIVGEVASSKVAAWMIEAGQVASLFTLFTHHAKTVTALIHSLRNSLLAERIFSEEKIAEEQVVEVVRFDVHLEKNREGKRYISRISEICPLPGKDIYRERILMVYRGGRYQRKEAISISTLEEMSNFLTEEEKLNLDFGEEVKASQRGGYAGKTAEAY